MDQTTYEKLVKTHIDAVYRTALWYSKSKEDAEDIVQNTFLKLLSKQISFQDEEHIRKWLLRVAINECKNLWSSYWRKNVDFLEEIKEYFATSEEKDYPEIYQAVCELAPKLRVVVYLFYYEEYSSKEISEILNVKEATVRTRLTRARKLLKMEFEKKGICF